MERKKNPFSFDYKRYLNSTDSFKMTYDEWRKKDEWENSDNCDNCGIWKGPLIICPECKL